MKQKNILLLTIGLLLLQLPTSLVAQEYLPFPRDSAVWYSVKSWPEYDPPPPVWYDTYKFEAKGDTLINNINYTKYYWYGAFGTRTGYIGAYRVEPDSNKVYYYPELDTCEYLAYDFNLLPGDTILIHHTEQYICIDTGRILLNNGIQHKTQTMLVPSVYNCYQFWVFGVGSLNLPLLETYWGCGYTFESAYELTCFYYKDEHIYEWFDNPYFEGCIGTNVGTAEYIEENTFAIVPNPVTGTSHLVCAIQGNTLYDYQIISIDGKILQSAEAIESGNMIIKKQNFPPGVYVLRFHDHENNHYYSRKFIVK